MDMYGHNQQYVLASHMAAQTLDLCKNFATFSYSYFICRLNQLQLDLA